MSVGAGAAGQAVLQAPPMHKLLVRTSPETLSPPVFVWSLVPVFRGAGLFPPGGATVGGVNAKTEYPAIIMPRIRPRIVLKEKFLMENQFFWQTRN
jgi:hypothetical protein